MGGDLNLKKSWHVGLLSNQKRVWESEQAALAERKKTAERVEELRKERAEEELQRQLEAAGGRKRVDRVDWMYQGPSDGTGMPKEESEAFLLGKRRIDNLIKGDEHKKLEKQASQDSFAAGAPGPTAAINARDMAAKMREDPLFAIKQREQASYDAIMNDPIKRRQLLASMGIEDGKREKKEHRHKRRHHHRHHRDGDESDEERRRRKRRRSDSREGSSRRRYEDNGSRHDKPRSRSRSPRGDDIRRNRRDRYRSRSRSPPRRDESRRDRSRSRSPPRRDDSRRDGYPRDRNDWRNSGRYQARDKDSRNGRASIDEEERARKLAAMQAAASDLDQDREQRLKEIEERDRADREADERAREKDSQYGGGRGFTNGLHRKAGDMGLGERMSRGRQGYQRDDD